jgi:hypothetical protein
VALGTALPLARGVLLQGGFEDHVSPPSLLLRLLDKSTGATSASAPVLYYSMRIHGRQLRSVWLSAECAPF